MLPFFMSCCARTKADSVEAKQGESSRVGRLSSDSSIDEEGMSTLGVSLQLLRELRTRADELQPTVGPPRSHRKWEHPPSHRAAGEPLTTEDVSLEIVMPATARMGCSFARLLASSHSDLAPFGSPADVGLASVFVSHAWSFLFSDLVGALESASDELVADLSDGKLFFWLDLCVNSQHRTFERAFEWWSSTFLNAVRRIGRTVIVLSPWRSPTPLTRAWCLWELHATAATGSALYVHMPPSERADFERTLVSDFNAIASALSTVDLAHSEAARASDRDSIFAAVRAGVTFHELNVQIKAALRSWLLTVGSAALAAADAQAGEQHGRLRRPLLLRNQLAVLNREHGHWQKAEELFRAELEACVLFSGGDESDVDTLVAMNNLAAIIVRRGRYDEAEPLLENALRAREASLGPAHEETLVVVGNLAALLRYRGDLKRAERLALRAHRGRVQELGEGHVNTAVAASNLALCKLDRGEHGEAQRLARLALQGARSAVGVNHPLALQMQVHLALVLANAPGEAWLDEAEELGADALSAHEQQSGRAHVDTLLAKAVLGLVRVRRTGAFAAQTRLKGLADMRASLEALRLPPHELPQNHWWMQHLRVALTQAERNGAMYHGGGGGDERETEQEAEQETARDRGADRV